LLRRCGARRNVVVHKFHLTPNRRRLIEWCQHLNFGTILGLVIRNGEPVFDPPPRCRRAVKFGGENGARPEINADNFILKRQVVELFLQLAQIGTGTVDLEVKHGLPFQLSYVEVLP